MSVERRAADEVVDMLLDEKNVQSPLEVTLRCKDERRKYFRFHRRFDPYGDAIYVIADEVAEDLADDRRGGLRRHPSAFSLSP